MATKESEGLQPNGLYALGNYNFRLERSSVPGSSNDQITAVCMNGGKNARKSIQVPSSAQVLNWRVEANGTLATVYATIKKKPEGPDIPYFDYAYGGVSGIRYTEADLFLAGPFYFSTCQNGERYDAFIASDSEINASEITWGGSVSTRWNRVRNKGTYTFNSKKVYYATVVNDNGTSTSYIECDLPNSLDSSYRDRMAWIMVYGGQEDQTEETMIGRFEIDLEDAGGVGPGSDWGDPGDYDEDWEEGDPSKILHIDIYGSLSGRHNDPLYDQSYSYVPADKATVKDYGCGGDGGNGGGGGAGASSIVVYKFATDKADSKEIVCKPKRHGYGSGGGKGGKGGDGCILIYY